MEDETPGAEPETAIEPTSDVIETNGLVQAQSGEPSDPDAELRTLFREMTTGEEEKPTEGAKPVVEKKAPVKGADGKFVKQAADAPLTEEAVAAETPEEKTARETAEAAAAEAAKTASPPEHAKAPTSWKGTAQAKWDALDPEVKSEIHRREANFHEGIQQYKQWADIGQGFDKEFRPYEAMIRSAGLTPHQLVKNWMGTEYQLKMGTPAEKASLFVEYAGKYGLTPENLAEAYAKAAEGKPAVDPAVKGLQDEVKSLKEQREQELRAVQERETAQIRSEVEAFAKATGHEHYETVKLDMAALMHDGRAKDMQEAYDKACRANPEIHEKLVAQRLEADRAKAAEKAAAAKKAAQTNVQPRGTPPRKPHVGTMDDTLKASYREIMARSA
jgi:hypothetical protein